MTSTTRTQMAIVAYALEMGGSDRAVDAYNKLMSMAIQDEQGLHWGAGLVIAEPKADGSGDAQHPRHDDRSAGIETTGYATLALLEHGDRLNASRSAQWLVSQRNSYGGFGSTQDTVVGLQALTQFAADAKFDVNMTVALTAGDWKRQVDITQDNADVLQTLEMPIGGTLEIASRGSGQVVVQVVRRFNLPEVEQEAVQTFQIDVDYGTDHVEVDEVITVSVDVMFNPPAPIEAGMVVLDVSVPTGFAPIAESIERMLIRQEKVKRHDVAGRKVILYIDDMAPGESLSFQFQARALYPVRAKPVTSQVYSYYIPEMKGETLAGEMTVTER